jgi:hypothetical protein
MSCLRLPIVRAAAIAVIGPWLAVASLGMLAPDAAAKSGARKPGATLGLTRAQTKAVDALIAKYIHQNQSALKGTPGTRGPAGATGAAGAAGVTGKTGAAATITAGSISGTKGTGGVSGSEIAANTLAGSDFFAVSCPTSTLMFGFSGLVTGTDGLDCSPITNADLGAGVVVGAAGGGTDDIQSASIGTADIANNAITSSLLAYESVDDAKLVDGAVVGSIRNATSDPGSSDIALGSIGYEDIGPGPTAYTLTGGNVPVGCGQSTLTPVGSPPGGAYPVSIPALPYPAAFNPGILIQAQGPTLTLAGSVGDINATICNVTTSTITLPTTVSVTVFLIGS